MIPKQSSAADRLPVEVIEQVLSYAGPQTTARAASINQKWHAASTSQVLWRDFYTSSAYTAGIDVFPKNPPEGLDWRQWYAMHDHAARQLPAQVAMELARSQLYEAPAVVLKTSMLVQGALDAGFCTPLALIFGGATSALYFGASIGLLLGSALCVAAGSMHIAIGVVLGLGGCEQMTKALLEGCEQINDGITLASFAALCATLGLGALHMSTLGSAFFALTCSFLSSSAAMQITCGAARDPVGVLRWATNRRRAMQHHAMCTQLQVQQRLAAARLVDVRQIWLNPA